MKGNISSKKRPFAVRLVFVIISILGAAGILIIKILLEGQTAAHMLSEGVMSVAHDNMNLYFKLSVFMCAVLLLLTLLSALTAGKGKRNTFSSLTVKLSPILSAVAMILLSAFYAYLTYDSKYSIVPALILLGISEAATFFLPLAIVYGRSKAGSNK